MILAKRTGKSFWRAVSACAVLAFCAGMASPAAAQGVDIDMPPPPKAKAKSHESNVNQQTIANLPPLTEMQREGRQALSRFAGARYGTDQRQPLGRRRHRSNYFGHFHFGHFHVPFFHHSFNFGFCW